MLFLNALLPPELKSSIDTIVREDGIDVLLANQSLNFSITAFLENTIYQTSLFKYYALHSPYIGEREYSVVRLSGEDRRTIGYIFPISSLNTGDEIEGKWPRIYGSIATRCVLFEGIGNSLLSVNFDIRQGNTYEISDFFPENFSILVSGQEALDALNITENSLLLMLQSKGFSMFNREISRTAVVAPAYNSSCNLKRLSSFLDSDVDYLLWIITNYSNESNLSAKFLGLYQIIEHLTRRVFDYEFSQLIKNQSNYIDMWEMKEKIVAYTSEKWRLSRLRQEYLHQNANSYVFIDNESACIALLTSSDSSSDYTNLGWANVLYRVRNIVVHRQVAMLQVNMSLLDDVCSSLSQVCFELLAHYIEPASSN